MPTLFNAIKEWLPLLPFMGMVNERRLNGKTSISVSRLVEALIIAGTSGAVAVYGTTIRLDSKFDQMEKNQVRIEMDAKEIKELARLTRESQINVVSANTVKLENIEKRLDQLDKRLRIDK